MHNEQTLAAVQTDRKAVMALGVSTPVYSSHGSLLTSHWAASNCSLSLLFPQGDKLVCFSFE